MSSALPPPAPANNWLWIYGFILDEQRLGEWGIKHLGLQRSTLEESIRNELEARAVRNGASSSDPLSAEDEIMIRCQTDIALFEKTYEHIIKTVGLSRWEDDGTRRKSATLHCVDEMPDDEDKGILAKFCMGLAHNIRGVQALRLPPVEKIERAREMLRQITGADPTLTWYRCAESSY